MHAIGPVRITSWYPNFNGSHFGLPPSSIHRMTGLGGKFVLVNYDVCAISPDDLVRLALQSIDSL